MLFSDQRCATATNIQTFMLIHAARPDAPQDVVAVQIKQPTGNCVATALWRNPDNITIAQLSHYFATSYIFIASNTYGSLQNTIPASNVNLAVHFTAFDHPTCDEKSISIQAIDVCGRGGRLATVTLNQQNCFITPDSVCLAQPTVITESASTKVLYTDSSTQAKANKPLQGE